MHSGKFFGKIALSLVLVMIVTVTACTAPTPAPATSAPQPAAATAAPAASQPAAPAQAGTGWCKDVRIVFFPGGPQGGVFAVNVYNGAKQAEADLGPKVDYVWSDWDPQKMI